MKTKNVYFSSNTSLKEKILSLDFKLIFLILLLGLISFFVMFSIDGGNFDYYTKNQIIRFFIFFLIFIILSFTKLIYWHRSAYIIYGIILLLLIAVDFFGIVSSGSKRWLNLFFINIQPSELMKIGLIIFLARFYHRIPSHSVNNIK